MKYFGVALLLSGIFLIFYGMFLSMEVFILKKEPPEIFKDDKISVAQIVEEYIEIKEEDEDYSEEENEEKIVLKGDEIDVEGMFPISEMLNILAISLFSGIIIFGGSKIAAIGVSVMS